MQNVRVGIEELAEEVLPVLVAEKAPSAFLPFRGERTATLQMQRKMPMIILMKPMWNTGMTRWIVPKWPGHVAMFLPQVWQISALDETPSRLSSTPFAAGSRLIWLKISLRISQKRPAARRIHFNDGHPVHVHPAEDAVLNGAHSLRANHNRRGGARYRGVFRSDTTSFTKYDFFIRFLMSQSPLF